MPRARPACHQANRCAGADVLKLHLAPSDRIAEHEVEAGKNRLVRDAAWASLTGSLSGGVVLVAFALALDAGPLAIGMLAAIPFLAQVAQLPGIALIERLRQRKRLAVWIITASRVVILSIAALPFVEDRRLAVVLLVAAQAAICLAGSLGACAVNSWLHQLIRPEGLGGFFARRLLWGTLLGSAGTLLAGQLIEHATGRDRLFAFAAAFVAAAFAGFTSSWHLARTPEPRMTGDAPREPLRATLRRPLADTNFRNLLIFLGSWTVASNLAAPFLAVYLMKQLGLTLGTVTALGVIGQLANAMALYLWGRLSDRLANKSVLAVALPLYFVSTAALVLAYQPDRPWLGLTLLFVLHVVMGAASGGIGLATGNLGLKLAPQGEGTAYLAMVGIVSAIGGGLAPLAAGAVAEVLEARQLSFLLRWDAPGSRHEMAVFVIAHWEFLFIVSALLGLYVLHRLSRVVESGEVDERAVVQEFAIEAARTVDGLSSIGGALGLLFPFRRFATWSARAWRGNGDAASGAESR
jgi:MFS family permease